MLFEIKSGGGLMKQKGYVEISIESCKGCSLCITHCPSKCLALNTADVNSFGLYYAYLAEPDLCIACANCAVMCPDSAIRVFKVKAG
jgi:2-oxoglutarate ferredoxin oxidoreductase subunit delta